MARKRIIIAGAAAAYLQFIGCHANADVLIQSLQSNLVCRYDFEHPDPTNADYEIDLGLSGTFIQLVNGGAAMRTNDGAYPQSRQSLRAQQVNPAIAGNDDWKAGIFSNSGIGTLNAFASVSGISLMGWVKPAGLNPSLNSSTATTNDYYNAVGLFGILSGNSEGHNVRALIEVINVSGTLRLVALGRRLDEGSSSVFAASQVWRLLIPDDTWSHLAATFNFDTGGMALYRNGELLEGTYTTAGDPWNLNGAPEPDLTSATEPNGIKIAGSFPQNTQERNPFNGQIDDLMFFDRVLTPREIQQQFTSFTEQTEPLLSIAPEDKQVTLSWSNSGSSLLLESNQDLQTAGWTNIDEACVTNENGVSVSLPTVDP